MKNILKKNSSSFQINKKNFKLNPPLRIIIPLCFWVVGLFFGFLFTALFPIKENNWRIVLGIRILFQLGTSIWFVSSLYIEYTDKIEILKLVKWLVVGSVLGLLLCFNPVLDFLQGPTHVQTNNVKSNISRGKMYRSGGGLSPTIRANVRFLTGEKDFYIKTKGIQANKWEEFWVACLGTYQNTVEAKFLTRLHIFLNLKCK